jgi:hypothetical protein
MIELEIRLPVWPVRLVLAALLLCVLSRGSISDDMAFNEFYGDPSGVYSGVLSTNADASGNALDTTLATNAGTVVRIQAGNNPVGSAAVKLFSATPLSALASGGMHSPYTGPSGAVPTLNTWGVNSGLGIMVQNVGGDIFRMYPWGANLALNYGGSSVGDRADGNTTFQLSANPDFSSDCSVMTYNYGGTDTCPAGNMVIGYGNVTGNGTNGTMYCCKLGLNN